MADETPGANGNERPLVTMTVTFDPQTGNVNVNGPIQDKIFCYGVLELAKDAIRRYNPNRIVAPALELPPEFRRQ